MTFGFIKKKFFNCNVFFLLKIIECYSIKCLSMNKQECKISSKIINVNKNEPYPLYPYSMKVNKCSGSCNSINDQYAKLCVPDVVKNINVEVFNQMSINNNARHIERHETCKYKCRLDVNVYNNKQRWNKDKCRCEYKELIGKRICDKGFIWNPSNCDKLCEIGEYLA